ncbi:MAG TPA: hypothetical protein VMD51_00725, partial [Mycobacterium sp.]|nr:hypothetical protein [Mycobacterium sp.]
TIAQVPADGGVEDGIPPDGVVPADILRALARLRLLEGVPFSYLVPDADLTPPETIRFFYLDRNATDALVQGALSVGTVNAVDRVQLAQLYPVVRDEVDEAERLVRMKDSDAPAVDAQGRPIGVAGPITGFVLRSRLVSGWPAMHVRAYATDTRPDDKTIPDMDTSPDRVRLLRMERLAPAVLFVLFDGVPAVVHIEEPRSGIQFGVRLDPAANPAQQTAVVTVRDVLHPNNGPLKVGGKARTVPVPFRAGSPGVINIKKLNDALKVVPGTNMGASVDSAEYAMQMLRFPLRQVFGDTSVAPGADSFVATVKIAQLAQRFELATQVLNG